MDEDEIEERLTALEDAVSALPDNSDGGSFTSAGGNTITLRGVATELEHLKRSFSELWDKVAVLEKGRAR